MQFTITKKKVLIYSPMILITVFLIYSAFKFWFDNDLDKINVWWGLTNFSDTGCMETARKSVEKMSGKVISTNVNLLYAAIRDVPLTISCMTGFRAIQISSNKENLSKEVFDIYSGYELAEKKESPFFNKKPATNLNWNIVSLSDRASRCIESSEAAAEELNFGPRQTGKNWSVANSHDGSSLAVICFPESRESIVVSSSIESQIQSKTLSEFKELFESTLKGQTPRASDQFSNDLLVGSSNWSGSFTYSSCQASAKSILRSYSITPIELNGGITFQQDNYTVLFLCAATGDTAHFFYSWPKKSSESPTKLNEILGKLQNRIK